MSYLPLVVLFGCGGPLEVVDTGPSDPPQLYLVSPKSGDQLPVGEAVEFRAIVSDDVDEATDLVVTVRLPDGSALTSGHPDKLGQLSLTAMLPEGALTLYLEVEDTEHHRSGTHVDVYSSPFTFDPPVVAVVPADAVTGEALAARIVVDALPGEGHLVDYTYAWTLDGEATEWTDATLPSDLVFSGDTWVVSVIGRSATAQSTPGTAELRIGNAPPALGDAVVEPSRDGQSVTCSHPEVTDAEGDRLTTRYRWDLDGALLIETAVSIPTPIGARSAAVGCLVSVSDGTTVVTASALPWALPNHAPTVPSVAVSPEVATADAPLSCILPEGAEDVDGDEVFVSLAWEVNGLAMQGDTSSFSGEVSRGDEVSCEATADDGLGGVVVVTSPPLTIDNSPPSTPTVRVDPAAPTAGETLTCSVVTAATDVDGDALRCDFRWEVGLPAGVGERFDTRGLAGGTAVTCVLTCFDGLESGRGGTDTVTLAPPISGDGSAGDAMVQIVGTTAEGRFGAHVVTLPDLDGDGRADLGIGAPGAGVGGAFYVFPAVTLLGVEQLSSDDASGSWLGDRARDNVGSFGTLAPAGDLDGDGEGDVIASAPWSDAAGHDAGQVYAIYGGFDLATDAPLGTLAAWTATGEPSDWFGSRVSGGDLDGDGLAELVASGPASDLGGAHSGVVAVFTGEASRRSGSLDLSDADAIVVGNAGDQLGWGLAVCADADGDGLAELAMGASRASAGGRADAGRVGLAGGASLGSFDSFEAVTWLRVAGDEAGDRVGASLACPGDLDDDGLGELVFGAPRHDTTHADAGQVAIFFGRAEADGGLLTSDADALVLGEAADDQLGSVVVSGGDLDHDGVVDLLLGAPGSAASAGLVDVLLSANAGDWSPAGVTPDARIAGNAMTDRIGEALAGGFDLEGDGFGEVALGAAHADAAITEGGAVYVFSGRSTMR